MCRLLLLVMFAGSISCLPVDPSPSVKPFNLTDADGRLSLPFEPLWLIVGQKGLTPPYRLFPLIPAITDIATRGSDYETMNTWPKESKSGWFLSEQKLWNVLEKNFYLKLIPIREGFQDCQSTDPLAALFAKVLYWFENNPNCLNNAIADPIQFEAEQPDGSDRIGGPLVAVPLPIGGGITAQIIGAISICCQRRYSLSSDYSVVRKWADRYAQTLFPSANAIQTDAA